MGSGLSNYIRANRDNNKPDSGEVVKAPSTPQASPPSTPESSVSYKHKQQKGTSPAFPTFDTKLTSIRELLDKGHVEHESFKQLVQLHGDKIFLEKYNLLVDIQRKIFQRILLLQNEVGDFHQLDDIVSLKDLLAVDSTSSPAIHTVFAKLYKFIYNYQASYERWIEILSTLEDELLLQIVGDYDDFISHHHDFDQHHHHRQFCAVMW